MASVRAVTSASVSDNASVVCNKPTGTVQDDILLGFQTAGFGGLTDMTAPTGGATWNSLESFGPEGDIQYAKVWWKVAGASEPSTYTFHGFSSGDHSVIVVAVEGVTSATPLHANSDPGTGGTSVATPSVTATAAGIEVRFAAGPRTGTTTWTPPAGYTEQVEVNSPGTDKFCATAASKVITGAGATGALNFTASASLDNRLGATITMVGSAVDATISAATLTAAGEIPAVTAHTGSKMSPATVTATGEVPAPTLHTDSKISPATVTTAVDVPAPNVVVGNATLIEAAVVTAAALVPAPTVTAVQSATVAAATVDAAGLVPAPTVTATTSATVSPVSVTASGLIPNVGVLVPILPGQFITADGQVEWNGVIWGEGTLYRVREITGWEAMPPADDLTVEEPNRHGANAGRTLLQRRTVTVKLFVDSISDPTQISGLLRQLRYDTRTLRDNTLWPLVIRGYTETLLAYGKVVDRTGLMDRDWSDGHPEPVITIMCPDSRRYGLEQHSTIIPANAVGATALVNDGELYTNPILRFPGPALNPVIVNETLDRQLAFDLTLGSGDLLMVDTQRGKVLIGNVDHEADISDTVSVPVKEFFLDVGSSAISYETDSGGTAGVEALWRDAHE